MLAIFPGLLLLLGPLLVSVYGPVSASNAWNNMSASPNRSGPSGDPVLSFVAILAPLFSGATVFYYHPHLNTTWKTAPAVPNPRPDDSGRYKAGLDSDPGMAR